MPKKPPKPRAETTTVTIGDQTFPVRAWTAETVPPPPQEAPNRVPARVEGVAYLGPTVSVVTDAGDLGRLVATLVAWQAPGGLEPGSEVWLSWAPDATVALADEPSGT